MKPNNTVQATCFAPRLTLSFGSLVNTSYVARSPYEFASQCLVSSQTSGRSKQRSSCGDNRNKDFILILENGRVEDFDEIFDILIDNAQWLSSKNIDQWPVEWLQSKRDEIKESLKKGNFFKSKTNNEISCVVELLTNEEAIWGYNSDPSIYIHKLSVSRRFSGLGLGQMVLDCIRDRAAKEGKQFIRLDCVSSNLELRKYYESYGFYHKGDAFNGLVELSLYEIKANG